LKHDNIEAWCCLRAGHSSLQSHFNLQCFVELRWVLTSQTRNELRAR
jgi:hypothetical protein